MFRLHTAPRTLLTRNNNKFITRRRHQNITMSSTTTTSSTSNGDNTSTAKHLQANTYGRNPYLTNYILDHCNEHPLSKNLRSDIEKESRAVMSGSPDEGALFKWLMPVLGCKKVLEVGVFRGATTMSLALGLPEDGKVVGLDVSAEYAATGMKYWEQAGVAKKIDFRLGAAVAEMDKMIANGESGTFDFVFIDADKTNYKNYYERSLQLLKKGGIIASDNCLWGGSVFPLADNADEDTKALAALNTFIKEDKRVDACMLVIADGVYFARKL